MKNLTAIILLLATTLANASEQSPARLYHWPYLKFTPYTNALGKKLPNGDISAKRAFYWGRVIGCDGVAFNVRGLTPALEEGNWFEPVYRSVKEKATIFGLMKQFQQMYARYGCSDNFLHLHAHPLLKRHPTHIPKDVKQWRKWVIDGMRQRAELLKHMQTERILIDLEFAGQKNVSTSEKFWFELGRDIARTLVRQHRQIRIGFYPGLYYHRSRKPPQTFAIKNVAKGDLRHAFLKGLYEGRGKRPLWYFSGYTYSIVDRTVAEKGATYVWDLPEHLKGLIQAHRQALGKEIEFMPGRWELGSTQRPTAMFGGLFKQPNLSLNMMRHDYKVLLKHTRTIGIWDHGWSWDPAGGGYKRFKTDADLAKWKQALAKASFSSRYRKNLKTTETWQIYVPAKAALQEKLKLFRIVKASDGSWLVSGKLGPDFARYVTVAKELTGKVGIDFPLHTRADVELAMRYQKQGFFPKRAIILLRDKRWPKAMGSMMGSR